MRKCICVHCGQRFETDIRERAKLCSDECRRRRHYAKGKAYYATNRAIAAAWRVANRERIRATAKAYREAHREQLSAQNKAYRQSNAERISAQRKERRRLRKLVLGHTASAVGDSDER